MELLIIAVLNCMKLGGVLQQCPPNYLTAMTHIKFRAKYQWMELCSMELYATLLQHHLVIAFAPRPVLNNTTNKVKKKTLL